MSLKERINRIYPSVKTEYLPNIPSITLTKKLESELSKRTTPEGLQRVKEMVETEYNLLESSRLNSFNPKSPSSEFSDFYQKHLDSESTRG